MAVGLQIEVDARIAQTALANIGKELNETVLLKAIGLRYWKWINDNLKGGGIEKAWAPMAPNTLVKRPQRPSRRHFSSSFQAALQQSFTSKVEGNVVRVGTQQRFADLHQEGTGPHTIKARRAKTLGFPTTEGVVFTPSVRHPGFPARPSLPSQRLARQLAVITLKRITDKIADASD